MQSKSFEILMVVCVDGAEAIFLVVFQAAFYKLFCFC